MQETLKGEQNLGNKSLLDVHFWHLEIKVRTQRTITFHEIVCHYMTAVQ